MGCKTLAQGGDWGSLVTTSLTTLYPEKVLGLHLNMFAVNTPASNLKYMASAMFPSLLLDKKDRSKILPLGEKIIFLLKETGYLHIQGKLIYLSNSFFLINNSILLLQLSRFAVSYLFSQLLRTSLCLEKVARLVLLNA